MELNFDIRRMLVLAVLLGGFAWWGGFTPPQTQPDGFHHSFSVSKAWVNCVIMFGLGAVSASLVEHKVGLFEPANLRPLYVLMGVLLMTAAVIWMQTLKDVVEARPAGGL